MLQTSSPSARGPHGRVLVVDDNEANRDLLEQELEELGFEVLAVEGGAECLAEVGPFAPDVVVLDIQMPGMNGFEVLDRLRATYAPRELPVLMATAVSATTDVVNAFDRGANDYVTKPIDMAILVARLRTLIRAKTARASQAAPVGGFASLSPPIAPAPRGDACCAHCTTLRADADDYCVTCGRPRPASGWSPIDRQRHRWLGETLDGRYLLDRFVDGGGQGQVYRAHGLDLGRAFAAKLVDLGSSDPDTIEILRDRLVQEVQAMVRLRNPHVVQIYEVVRISDTVYALLMEWVPGLSLDRWVGTHMPMTAPDALGMMRQAALGLLELHRHGMVHRDVKPSNLMIEQLHDGEFFVKLLDFGISVHDEIARTDTQFLGSVNYAAPEQARPDARLDKRADLYALGCTLWFALKGHPPFAGSDAAQVMRRHAHDPLPPLTDGAQTPDHLVVACDVLIQRLTAKSPDHRIPDVPALLDRIDVLLQGVRLKRNVGPRLELRERLGHGESGEVYRGRMRREGGVSMDVAIKLLYTGVEQDPSGARLRDKGRRLASLDHPGILKFLDLTTHEGRLALVTEYVDGTDLADCLRGTKRLPRRALYETLERAASALDAAWNTRGPAGEPLRLVHRDVKPRNIRLGRHGEVKLLDFGLSRAEALEQEHRIQRGVLGTRLYMAPERQEGVVGPEGDVFALGCILFEGLTGERLLGALRPEAYPSGPGGQEAWADALRERLERLPPEVEPDARTLLGAMIALNPAARATAGEVAARCATLSEQAPPPGLKAWWRELAQSRGPLDPETTGSQRPLDGPSSEDTIQVDVALLASTDPPAPSVSANSPEARAWRAPALIGVVLLALCMAWYVLT